MTSIIEAMWDTPASNTYKMICLAEQLGPSDKGRIGLLTIMGVWYVASELVAATPRSQSRIPPTRHVGPSLMCIHGISVEPSKPGRKLKIIGYAKSTHLLVNFIRGQQQEGDRASTRTCRYSYSISIRVIKAPLHLTIKGHHTCFLATSSYNSEVRNIYKSYFKLNNNPQNSGVFLLHNTKTYSIAQSLTSEPID